MFASIHNHTVEFLPEGEILFEKNFDIALARIYSSGVMHLYFFSGNNVSMTFVQEVYDFVIACGNNSHKNLYEFEALVDLDPEVRSWASAPNGNKNTIADALVINNLAHKLMANFYLKYNKPVKPTRIFTNREKALNWLRQF